MIRRLFWHMAGRFYHARAARALRRWSVLRDRAEACFARIGGR